ncbi:MAG: hypothetical protein J5501_08565, partial [Ruminococcus sp.]|nr:hypothetical protein [Ruminococcus sp.]
PRFAKSHTMPKRNTSRGKEGGKKKTAAKTGISLPPFPSRFSSLDSLFPFPLFFHPLPVFALFKTRRLKEAIARAA